MMRKHLFPTLVATLVTGSIAAGGACAGNLVDVQILNRNDGNMLATYGHRGETWVAGNPGESYAVRLVNRTGKRILTVLSVDGVNAVSGETASSQQSGYVLEPWASAEIRGWRKSLNDVAQFYFTPLSDSYAARSGRPGNVGVIGVAVFREYVEPRPALEMKPRAELPAPASPKAEAQGAAREAARDEAASAGAPAAESAQPLAKRARPYAEERLGTGHGGREHAPVTYTEFRRASDTPTEMVQIRYDSYANLLARGIVPRPPYYGNPQPFPRDVPGPFVPHPQG